jgi:hypothetical protein
MDIKVEDYTEKSFKVSGEDTKKYKNQLKELGKWNPNLRDGPGYIVSKQKKDQLNELIDQIKKGEIKPIEIEEVEIKFVRNIKGTNIKIETYGDKSYKVSGTDTKKYYVQFKELGKWNTYLQKGAGYIVSLKKKDVLDELANRIESGEESEKPKVDISNPHIRNRSEHVPLNKLEEKSIGAVKGVMPKGSRLPILPDISKNPHEQEYQEVKWTVIKPYVDQYLLIKTGKLEIPYRVTKVNEDKEGYIDRITVVQDGLDETKDMVIVNGEWRLEGPYEMHEVQFY